MDLLVRKEKKISLWQIFVAEVIGTAILILIGIGAIPATLLLLGSSGGKAAFTIADRGMIALTVGFIIAAAIYSLGHISGGHVNPSVTFALAVTKRLPWKIAGVYFAAQLIGSVIGAAGILLYIGVPAARQVGLGQNIFAPGTSYIQAFFAEVVAAFALLFIVGGCLFDRRAAAGWGGLVVAMVIFAEIVALANPSSLSINFARTFGPAIVMLFVDPSQVDLLQVFTVFLFGPLVGAALGALAYDFVAGLRVTPEQVAEETVGGIEKTAVEGVAALLENPRNTAKRS